MGREVYFTPSREGWQHKADPTGLRGEALRVVPGGSAELRLAQVGPSPACDAGPRRAATAVLGPAQLFRIDAIDAATGRGVPLIELRAPDGTSWWTDNQGIVAFDDPASMGRRLRFEVRGDGYRALDPSGFAEIEPRPGRRAVIGLERLDIAERLYRVTGTGLYRDSVRLGLPVPIGHPLVNAGVAGQDSVQALLYRGRVFWIWGDTPSIANPLWNFHTTGATSRLPADGGLDPAIGVDLDYLVGPDGNVRPMTAIPGPGATWLTALVNVPDARGEETLFALYGKHTRIDPPDERGLARFDPSQQVFLRALVLEDAMPVQPHGSALLVRGADGAFVHYADDVRIPARAESLGDPSELGILHAVSRAGRAGRARPGRRDPLCVAARRAGRGRGGRSPGPAGARRGALRAGAGHRERPVRSRPRHLDGGESVSGPLRPHLHRAGGHAVTPRRGLVRRSRHADGALALRAQDREPPQLQLLQPVPPRRLRPARRAHAVLRGHLHGGLRRIGGADASLRLQPDHAPPRPRGPAPAAARPDLRPRQAGAAPSASSTSGRCARKTAIRASPSSRSTGPRRERFPSGGRGPPAGSGGWSREASRPPRRSSTPTRRRIAPRRCTRCRWRRIRRGSGSPARPHPSASCSRTPCARACR